jgi:hypothetical protein
MGDNGALAAAFEEVLQTGDFAKVGALIQERATDDFVQEWPQSGERMTRDQAIRIGESYEAGSGTSPRFTYHRMIGGGDVFVVEGTIDYGDGTPVRYVGIGEIRGGKIARVTEYFANPFEAPEWRKGMTGRMEQPVGA